MNSKIATKERFDDKFAFFMKSKKDTQHCILNSAVTIFNIDCLNEDIGQFVKGAVVTNL